jgi:predicted RNA-binding Zn-ribbon protein involved in translation (DUF1610 family)
LQSRNRSIVRPCPLCGIAMQAAKTRDDFEQFDHFECQHCGTVITEAPRPPLEPDKK